MTTSARTGPCSRVRASVCTDASACARTQGRVHADKLVFARTPACPHRCGIASVDGKNPSAG
jgi:hypothetical protein